MSSLDEQFSIGELATRTGAPISTLRYWERAGLLDPPARESGQRRYRDDAVERVGLIRICQDAGFGIGETRALLEDGPDEISTWTERAEAKLAELHADIAAAQRAAEFLEHSLRCKEPTLRQCPTFQAAVHLRATGADLVEPV